MTAQTVVALIATAVLVLVALALIVRRITRAIDAVIAADMKDFVQTFPGRCPICSYDRVGRAQGMDLGPIPDHSCPEKRGGL